MNHFAVHVCQAEAAALMFESQLLMVNAQNVHQRSLKIVDMDGVLGGVHAEDVAGTIGDAGAHAAAAPGVLALHPST